MKKFLLASVAVLALAFAHAAFADEHGHGHDHDNSTQLSNAAIQLQLNTAPVTANALQINVAASKYDDATVQANDNLAQSIGNQATVDSTVNCNCYDSVSLFSISAQGNIAPVTANAVQANVALSKTDDVLVKGNTNTAIAAGNVAGVTLTTKAGH